MSEEQTATMKELRRIVRVLERLGELARQSSRHGTLRDGQAYAIQQYNTIIEALAARGIEVPSYFPPLTGEAGMGALGFASAQLAEYLSEMVDAEGNSGGEGGGPGKEGSFFNQFFGSGEFQHIGEAMRQAIPDWVREAHRRRADFEARRDPEHARATAGEARAESSGTASTAGRSPGDPLNARLAQVSARMAAIVAQMRRPETPPEELRRLAEELGRLGEEQARAVGEAGGTATSDVNLDLDVDL